MVSKLRWHLFPTAGELVEAVVDRVLKQASAAILARGRFVVVLAGGTTPLAMYRRLRQIDADWPRWYILFGDERCRPAGDQERNDTLADTVWLSHVAIPQAQVYRIPAEQGPSHGSEAYARAIADFAVFDLTLLGLGEDGHTASLFPGQQQGFAADAPDVVPVVAAPKPPSERISLSATRLSRSRQVLLVAIGDRKRAAVQRLAAGEAIPAACIRPPGGMEIYVDHTAAPEMLTEQAAGGVIPTRRRDKLIPSS